MKVVVCVKQIPDPATPYKLEEGTNWLVRPAEQLRYSGFRPERVRMARRNRRRPDISDLLAEPMPWKEQSLLQRCGSGLPLIPIAASEVRVETNLGPQGFHIRLRDLLRNARRRVVLASLYLGTGPFEQELIRDLRHAIESSEELRVTIVVDHSRGLRPTANGDTTTMLASLLREFPERVELYLYKMPQLSGARAILPSPLDECVAVSHFKCLVFDDTAIVTGANLSEEDFTCRQARFVVVRDSRFADFFAQVVDPVDRVGDVVLGVGGDHGVAHPQHPAADREVPPGATAAAGGEAERDPPHLVGQPVGELGVGAGRVRAAADPRREPVADHQPGQAA